MTETVFVKLRDSSGSFADPSQKGKAASIHGNIVFEVEPTSIVLQGINGHALVRLSDLEVKAYKAELEKEEAIAEKIAESIKQEEGVSDFMRSAKNKKA